MAVEQMQQLEERVLLAAPASQDAAACQEMLAGRAIGCVVVEDGQSLHDELHRGVGAVIITQAMVESGQSESLERFIAEQPPWSHLPVILLMDGGPTAMLDVHLQALGNPIPVARPFTGETLVGIVESALGMRRHQYAMADRMRRLEAERSRLATNERHFRTALRGAPVIVSNQDRDLRYTWMYNMRTEGPENAFIGMTDADFLGPEEAQPIEALKRQVMSSGKGARREFDIHYGDRHWVWDVSLEPLRDRDGTIIGVTCTSTDVTEHWRRTSLMRFFAAANAALASDLNFDVALQQLAHVAVKDFADWCLVDLKQPDGSFRRLVVTYHDPAQAELAKLIASRVTPADVKEPFPFARALATGEPELLAKFDDNVIRERAMDDVQLDILRRMHVRSAIIMPLIVKDVAVGVMAFGSCRREYTHEDLSMISELMKHASRVLELDQVYDALCISEQRYRLVADAANDAIWDWNIAEDAVEWSEKIQEKIGCGPPVHGSAHQWWVEHIHEDDRQRVLDSLQALFESRQVHWMQEYRLRRKDGGYISVMDRGAVIYDHAGKAVRMVGAAIDMTDRKRAEEALRISEERFRLAARATNDVVWDWDLITNAVDWSESLRVSFGHDPNQVPDNADEWDRLIHPDDRERVLRGMQRTIEGGAEFWTDEYRFLRADGTYADVLDRGYVVHDSEGRPVRMIGAMVDVSQRKRVETELRNSEQRFRVMAQALPQIVWTADADGEVDFYNDRWEQFTGMSVELSHREGWKNAIHPDDRRQTSEAWRRALSTGHLYQIEHRIRRHDGVFHWHLTRAVPLRDDEGRIVMWLGTATDFHDQKEAEEALKRSQDELKRFNETLEQRIAERTAVAEQRAMQLRVLASELTSTEQRERRRLANILHDHLQQLLVAATMKIGLLRSRVPSLEGKQVLQQIKDLLNQSIASSRSLTVELSPPVLYDAGLAAALNWLAGWMNEKHDLKVEVEAEPQAEPLAEDVRAFFFQAVRELLFNVVKHANTDSARVEVKVDDESQLIISVKDDGTGMDPQVLSQMDSGEGFGLFNIRERLELLGGRLQVDSTPGEGTTISMIVPRDQLVQAADELQVAAPDGVRRTGGGGRRQPGEPVGPGVTRVLLADDHQIVREGLMGLIQEHSDIAVIGEACDGQMAVEMARELKPDVVIMDVSMPQLNGIEATRRIVAELPQVRVIGLSMHERETMAAAMRQAGASAYLPKGGPSEPLIAAIRGVQSEASELPPPDAFTV